MQIVAFTGGKGSGKDTAAQALPDYEVVKFAGALKGMLEALLRYRGCPEEMIPRYIEGNLKESPCPYLSGRTMRYAMQKLGTEWGREMMSDSFWIDAVEDHIDSRLNCRIVVTDVRFANEVDFIASKGGRVYHILRDLLPGIIDSHVSETGVPALHCHDVIRNDGTIEDLHDQIRDKVLGKNR